MSVELFPDLPAEQAHLARARQCRDEMVARLADAARNHTAADEITQEYIEVTVEEALADLAAPGAGDFFGRIDEQGGAHWHIGRRHIEDGAHDPVVIDWRAAVAAPFYRATGEDNLGLHLRRRFTLVDGELAAYLDEHLDDPDEAGVAGGIPDPVLAEIGAARGGAMREIVATIQAEQDRVIRSPLDLCLVVQGGPGTGKTAVGLHRVAYLLFENRRRLSRDGVLVVGPNRVFLEYVADVLPSLGERSVQQRTLLDLASPRVEIAAVDSVALARLKGDARLAPVLERAALAAIGPPKATVRAPLGARNVTVEPYEMQAWLDAALAGNVALNRRRDGFRALVAQELERRTGVEGALGRCPPIRAALDKAWPIQRPEALVRRVFSRPDVLAAAAAGILTPGEQTALRRRGKWRWTEADAVVLDEATGLLNGAPATYGHVVVDEAQDLSPLAVRAIARRCPSGSLTVLGDLAQSTGAAGAERWDTVLEHLGAPDGTVEVLTIGYRVPGPILEVANRLLPGTGVDVPASRSARVGGDPPLVRRVAPGDVARATAAEVEQLRRHHHLTGVIAPAQLITEITDRLADRNLTAVGHLHGRRPNEIPIFAAEAAKGLEFDAVVVVEPGLIHDGTSRGARLLYVALTRAVQVLTMVVTAPVPAVLGVV
jgi:DNA helicase IV